MVESNMLHCQHGTIAAGGQSAVSVLATLPSLASQPVVATLVIDSLVDINGSDNRAGLDVMLQTQGAQLSQEVNDGSAGMSNDVPRVMAGTGRVSPMMLWLWVLSVLAHALNRVHGQRLQRQAVLVARQWCQCLDRLRGDRIGA